MNARELSLVSRYVLQNGKALVIAANKIDVLLGQEERQLYLRTLRECLVGQTPCHAWILCKKRWVLGCSLFYIILLGLWDGIMTFKVTLYTPCTFGTHTFMDHTVYAQISNLRINES